MIFQKSLTFFLSLFTDFSYLIMYYILKFPQRILPPFLLFFFPMYFAFPGLNYGFLCCCDTGTEFQLLDVRTHCVY